MARLDTMPEPMRSHLAELPCPVFDTRPWVSGPPLSRRRVAIISTAGLHRREDRPFEGIPGPYSLPGPCGCLLPWDVLWGFQVIPAFSRSWFWQKTAAGALLRAVKEKCSASEDKALKITGKLLLVPLDQAL